MAFARKVMIWCLVTDRDDLTGAPCRRTSRQQMFADHDLHGGAMVPTAKVGYGASMGEATAIIERIHSLTEMEPSDSEVYARMNELLRDCLEQLRDTADLCAELAGRGVDSSAGLVHKTRKQGFGCN